MWACKYIPTLPRQSLADNLPNFNGERSPQAFRLRPWPEPGSRCDVRMAANKKLPRRWPQCSTLTVGLYVQPSYKRNNFCSRSSSRLFFILHLSRVPLRYVSLQNLSSNPPLSLHLIKYSLSLKIISMLVDNSINKLRFHEDDVAIITADSQHCQQ